MKLLHSATSPYARKVLVVAHETGAAAHLSIATQATAPLGTPEDLVRINPLGKVPALILDDGTVLYDSRVICEFLDAWSGGPRLFPAAGDERWRSLVQQALADGLLDAALLLRYEETLRPEQHRFKAWQNGQAAKIVAALDRMESTADALEGVTIGSIATACALGYLDLRFASLAWRTERASLAAWYETFRMRPSMLATAPAG